MAAYFAQYALTASAATLTSIFGKTLRAQQIDIKNSDTAVNKVYIGPSTVTNVPANAGVQLGVGQAWSALPSQGRAINTDESYIVGTANAANIAFITVIE